MRWCLSTSCTIIMAYVENKTMHKRSVIKLYVFLMTPFILGLYTSHR